MNILVTGGAGFIGSHLCDALIEHGMNVSVIDDFSTGRLENIAHLMGRPFFRFTRSQVENEALLNRYAADSDVIVHLAAAVGVRLVVENPVHTICTNVLGSLAVFRAAETHNCRVIMAGTSEVYGKGSRIPFSENDDVVLGPTSKSRWSYACSKMLDEFLGLAYLQETGLQVTIVRLFNTIGPRQTGRYGMVVPRFVQQALRSDPITVHGDGTQERCFCDVNDVVRAFTALVEKDRATGKVLNVGSTTSISIMKLAETVRRVVGSESSIITVPYSEAYGPGFEDMKCRVPDIRAIGKILGWHPEIPLETSLERIRDFMLEQTTQKEQHR